MYKTNSNNWELTNNWDRSNNNSTSYSFNKNVNILDKVDSKSVKTINTANKNLSQNMTPSTLSGKTSEDIKIDRVVSLEEFFQSKPSPLLDSINSSKTVNNHDKDNDKPIDTLLKSDVNDYVGNKRYKSYSDNQSNMIYSDINNPSYLGYNVKDSNNPSLYDTSYPTENNHNNYYQTKNVNKEILENDENRSLPRNIYNVASENKLSMASDYIECARVKSFVDSLKAIKPDYEISMEKLLKTGTNEARIINHTVRLYSNLLCNWKIQTAFIYKKMKDALLTLQSHLESQVLRNRLLVDVYSSEISSLKITNLQYEKNIRKMQEYINNLMPKIPSKDHGYNELINKRNSQLNLLREKFEKLSRVYLESMKSKKENQKNEYGNKIICNFDNSDIDDSIKHMILIYERICTLRSNSNTKVSNIKNLDSPNEKPEILELCNNLKMCCGSLSFKLQNLKVLEVFVNNDSPCLINSKDIRKSLTQLSNFTESVKSPVSSDSTGTLIEDGSTNTHENMISNQNKWEGNESIIKQFFSDVKNCKISRSEPIHFTTH